MSIFDPKELLEAINGEQVNPLRTIGFNAELLRINLTEDEFWDVAKKLSRDIVMKIHPDLENQTERTAAAAFRNAFEALKDRKQFLSALADLKRDYNEIRSDENLKKRTEGQLQNRLNEANRTILESSERNKALDARNHELIRQIMIARGSDCVVICNREGKARLPLEQIRMPRQLGRAIAMRIGARAGNGIVGTEELLQEIVETYHQKRAGQRAAKAKYGAKLSEENLSIHVENAHRALIKNGFNERSIDELIDEALPQKVPTIGWGFGNVLTAHRIVRSDVKLIRIPPTRDVLEATSFEKETFLATYRALFLMVTDILRDRMKYVTELQIYPEIIDLTGGSYKKEVAIGSAFLQEQKKPVKIRPFGFKLGMYPDDLTHQVVAEGALIALTSPTEIGASGKDSLHRAHSIQGQLGNTDRKTMTASHLLIEML